MTSKVTTELQNTEASSSADKTLTSHPPDRCYIELDDHGNIVEVKFRVNGKTGNPVQGVPFNGTTHRLRKNEEVGTIIILHLDRGATHVPPGCVLKNGQIYCP